MAISCGPSREQVVQRGTNWHGVDHEPTLVGQPEPDDLQEVPHFVGADRDDDGVVERMANGVLIDPVLVRRAVNPQSVISTEPAVQVPEPRRNGCPQKEQPGPARRVGPVGVHAVVAASCGRIAQPADRVAMSATVPKVS